ncbi:MAG TPA: DUF3473 domain-containing protein, partial [Steroidobacter sp.]|nr:DUF3473 domain-containing protein [Steroidobacter sp.]
RAASGRLLEIPLTTIKVFGQHVPCAGGGYFRLLPYGAFRWAVRRANTEGLPAVFYMHPWEIDPAQPRIDAPWRSRFRHYTNLHRTESRLEALLGDFRWASMEEVVLGRPRISEAMPLSPALVGNSA